MYISFVRYSIDARDTIEFVLVSEVKNSYRYTSTEQSSERVVAIATSRFAFRSTNRLVQMSFREILCVREGALRYMICYSLYRKTRTIATEQNTRLDGRKTSGTPFDLRPKEYHRDVALPRRIIAIRRVSRLICPRADPRRTLGPVYYNNGRVIVEPECRQTVAVANGTRYVFRDQKLSSDSSSSSSSDDWFFFFF